MANVPARMRIGRAKRLCAGPKPGRFAKWIGDAGRPKSIKVPRIPYPCSIEIRGHIRGPGGERLDARATAEVMFHFLKRHAVGIVVLGADVGGVNSTRHLEFRTGKMRIWVRRRTMRTRKQDDHNQKRLYELAGAGQRAPVRSNTTRATR